MNKLNKTFLSGNVLTAAELNLLTAKIDEIITNWPTPGDDNQNDGLTDEDVQNKVDAAKAQLQDLIDEMNASIASLLAQVEGLKEGTTTVDNKEEFLKALRQQCNVVLLDLNLTKKITLPDGTEQIVPAIDLAVIQEDVDNLKSSVAALEVLPGKIGMIANHFDENGNPIYNGAEIIATINNEGESTVGISADKIVLDGTTFAEEIITKGLTAGKLTATLASIENLVVTGTFKTGSTGYIAEMGATDDSGYFDIYNALTNIKNVHITGFKSSSSYSSGAYIAFRSSDYSPSNKTGWEITIGGHGIHMTTYIRGKESTFGLSPDTYNAYTNTSVEPVGQLYFETIENDTALYRRTIGGNNVDTYNN